MPDQSIDGTGVSVLLFERDPETLDILQSALAAKGYPVEVVKNALACMKAIASGPPGILIAAYESSELSGPTLIEKLDTLHPGISVILTGPASDGAILRSFRAGAVDFWTSPLDGEEIHARLDHLISPAGRHLGQHDMNRRMETLSREKQQLDGLLRIASSLSISGDTKESLNTLTELAAEIMHCEAASIMLVNQIENTLEFVVASGEKKHRLETIKIPIGEGIAGWVALHGTPQIVNDTAADSRFTGAVDEESGFTTRQILAVPMLLENEVAGVVEVINASDGRKFTNTDLQALTDMARQIVTVIAATRKIEDQQNFFVQITNILVKAIEKKDMYSEGHSWRVAEYCHKIAAVIGMNEYEKDNLHFGALLHDIGKLNLPSYIFNRKTLSDRERELIRQHPVQGAKLLEPITLWKWVVPYILYHHESWDGSGYPFGRSGESIPIGARIINIAEAFSVMRATGSYKKQMTLKESILELMRMSGVQFDPELVKVFIGVLEKENWPR